MTRPGGGAHGGGAAHDRLAEEARATASALLEWLGTRVDQAAAPGGYGARPAQSPGPCTWCPVCALVAAMRGEQPELTARLAEQASGFMLLLRAMAQAHDAHGHGSHPAHDHPAHAAPEDPAGRAPAGWPPEWGEPSWSADPGPRHAAAPGPDTADRTDRTAHSAHSAHSADEVPSPEVPVRGTATGAPRRTAAFRPTRATRHDTEAGATAPTGTDEAEAAPVAREARASRPRPRRAPARTTSPRTAARRPSPRAASMPAPGGVVPEQGSAAQGPPLPAPPAAPAEPQAPRAAPDPGGPVAAAPGAPASPSTGSAGSPGGRPRPPVQSISVRRRPDGR